MEAYGWKPNYIRWKITSAEGWVYYNWARQNKGSVWGTGEKPTSPGYVRQETLRVMEERQHG
jgi:hypothetical protein